MSAKQTPYSYSLIESLLTERIDHYFSSPLKGVLSKTQQDSIYQQSLDKFIDDDKNR
tara:strand:- start:603 stop:773 length:171 start_codon:yes stop_codon:yes gene_type:complete